MIATAMLSAFSVVYRKFKHSILIQLEDIEIDLIIFNRVTAVLKSIIRKESRSTNPFESNIFKSSLPMSHEELISEMIEKDKEAYPSLKLEIEVKQTPLDEFMKCLEVIAYHPKTGKRISQKVILSLHPQLTLNIDDLNIDLIENSLPTTTDESEPMKE
nr:unnamed protein product [Naegleria fowleri]